MLERIDTEKIQARIKDIDSKLLEIQKLEDEREELKDILRVVEWYFGVKRTSFAETLQDVGSGKVVKCYPLRTKQAWQEYNWLKDYPLIGLHRGWERACRFVASHGATPGELQKHSLELVIAYQNNGIAGEMTEFLKPYYKPVPRRAKHSEDIEALQEA